MVISWLTSSIASAVGTPVESVYLMMCLLLSYPIAVIYNQLLVDASRQTKLLYYLISGMTLVLINNGLNIVHSLAVCLQCYATIRWCPIRTALVINVVVPMVYLLYGCHITQIGSIYTIGWTLPQCVLTLRLIAVTFDVYDGQRNAATLKKSDNNHKQENDVILLNLDTAIPTVPTLIEFLSHCYFPYTILVGPLISYNKYMSYIKSQESHISHSYVPALGRLAAGLVYLYVYVIGCVYWPQEYLLTHEFEGSDFMWKITAVAIVCKIGMTKYLASWLISEGSCILSGISWDGKSYYTCANIYVWKFETTPTFDGVIKSFNLSTNSFAAKYLFKRFKFLGNRMASQSLTLIFLAIWHGLSTGYYVTFLMEFLIMKMEMDVLAKVAKKRNKSPKLDSLLNSYFVKMFIWIVFRIYTIYLLGYSFMPFMHLQYPTWYHIYSQVYWYGHVIVGTWIIISAFVV